MTNTAMAAAPTAAPRALPARLIGVLTSPMATFQTIVANPRWFGALAVTTLLVSFFSALPMTTEAGRQATLDQQVTTMKSFGVEVTPEMYDRMERSAARLPYTTAAGVIVMYPKARPCHAGERHQRLSERTRLAYTLAELHIAAGDDR